MAFDSFTDANQRQDLNRERGARLQSTPLTKYQLVAVQFPVANQDVDIVHDLAPTDPESVCWVIVKQSGNGQVYQDQSPTRLPWQPTHIFLRSSATGEAVIMVFLPSQTLDPLPPFTTVPPTPGGGPADPDTSVQFNDSGVFGGSAGFTFLKGPQTVAIGTGHTLGSSSESLAVGFQNTITATDSVAIGFNVNVSGDDVIAAGESLTVSGVSSGVFGSANTVAGNYNLVGGSQGSSSGSYNLVGGSQAVAGGSYGIIGGSANTTVVGSDYALLVGFGNTLTSATNGGYLIGDQLTVTGDRNLVIGLDGSAHTVTASNRLTAFATDFFLHGGTVEIDGEGTELSFGSPTKYMISLGGSSSWAGTLRRSDLGDSADISYYNFGSGIEFSSSTHTTYWDGATGIFTSNFFQAKPGTFASLPGSPAEGTTAAITDSTTNTWGATISGGGTNHVLGSFNGTNWTVVGK